MQSAEKYRKADTSAKSNRAALASNAPSDAKIFLKMLGFPAFSKTLALLRSSPLERDLVLLHKNTSDRPDYKCSLAYPAYSF